jgi:hypothetical protein
MEKKILKHKFEGKGDLRITLGEMHVKLPSRIRRQFDIVFFIGVAFKRAAISVLRHLGGAQRLDLICHATYFYNNWFINVHSILPPDAHVEHI